MTQETNYDAVDRRQLGLASDRLDRRLGGGRGRYRPHHQAHGGRRIVLPLIYAALTGAGLVAFCAAVLLTTLPRATTGVADVFVRATSPRAVGIEGGR